MRIITHDGKAHVDEVIACAILAAVHPEDTIEVIRVPQVPKNIKPDTFIVDIGGEYDGDRKFDHHQLDKKISHCSASLVADRYAKELMIDSRWKRFIDRIANLDSNGPHTNSLDMKAAAPLLQLERGIVKFFESEPTLVTEFLGEFIKNEISRIATFNAEIPKAAYWLRENARVRGLNRTKVMAIPTILNELPFDEDILNAAIGVVVDEQGVDIVHSVKYCEETGTTISKLYRTRNGKKKGVDFTKCTPKKPIKCHRNGFLLTFESEDEPEWVSLIKQSQQ